MDTVAQIASSSPETRYAPGQIYRLGPCVQQRSFFLSIFHSFCRRPRAVGRSGLRQWLSFPFLKIMAFISVYELVMGSSNSSFKPRTVPGSSCKGCKGQQAAVHFCRASLASKQISGLVEYDSQQKLAPTAATAVSVCHVSLTKRIHRRRPLNNGDRFLLSIQPRPRGPDINLALRPLPLALLPSLLRSSEDETIAQPSGSETELKEREMDGTVC